MPQAKPRASYHHGDLRAQLVDAAREALETAPAESLTLKALAVRLGVSQPAPYRHFANRDALLAAVAADGYDRFTAALREALEGPPATELERLCLAYIAFGLGNMGVYRLMFSRTLFDATGLVDGPLARAAAPSFDLLVDQVSRRVPPDRALKAAVGVWSGLHGVVMLRSEGLLTGELADHVSLADIVGEITHGLGV